MTLKQTGACWTVTGARVTAQREIIRDAFCAARVASPRSWSRRVRGKKSLTCQNLPVEAWVSVPFSFFTHLATAWRSHHHTLYICGSVTLAMLSGVPAVRIWGCQHSNQERRSCWTTRHWRMLETPDFTHHTTETLHSFFFFLKKIKTTCRDKILPATTPLHIWWGFVFTGSAGWPQLDWGEGSLFEIIINYAMEVTPFFFFVGSPILFFNVRIWQHSITMSEQWDLNGISEMHRFTRLLLITQRMCENYLQGL